MNKKILFLFFIQLSILGNAQEIPFSLLQHSSININPAFSGNSGSKRIVHLYQIFFKIQSQNMYLSYDQPLKTGYGNIAYRGTQSTLSDGFYKTQESYISYSKGVHIGSKKILIKPAIEFGFTRHKWTNTNIPSYIHPLFGPTSVSTEAGNTNIDTDFNINSGLILSGRRLIFGFSIKHIYQKTNKAYKSPKHFQIHFSYNFKIGEDAQLSPLLHYARQGDFEEVSLNASFIFYNKILFSVGSNSNPQFNYKCYKTNIGYAFKKFVLGYSYTLIKSTLRNAKLNKHEVTLAVKLNKKETKIKDAEFINF